jgi:hypothetical protein
MSSTIGREQWTIIDHTNVMSSNTEQPQVDATTSKPTVELTLNAKTTKTDAGPDTTAEKKDSECICPVHPTLKRDNTFDTEEDDWYPPRSRPQRRAPPIRRYSISPVRYGRPAPPPPLDTAFISSSTILLSQVNSCDGIVELPQPAQSNAYLTTFPFTNKDVKKYTWLFASGVEDHFLTDYGRDATDDYAPYPAVVRTRNRSRSPYYNRADVDIPTAFLSRALDTSVVPEDGENKVKYWIVVAKRQRPHEVKLIVAESRKAAGIFMYCELLNSNSVSFVGAVLDDGRKLRGMKFKRVESLQEAVEMKDEEEGVVGVVC